MSIVNVKTKIGAATHRDHPSLELKTEQVLLVRQRVGHRRRNHRADGLQGRIVNCDRPRGESIASALLNGVPLTVDGDVRVAHGLL